MHEEISCWKRWSLENTHSLLQKKFPDSAIFIIQPTIFLKGQFSCYHNFVNSSIVGKTDQINNRLVTTDFGVLASGWVEPGSKTKH